MYKRGLSQKGWAKKSLKRALAGLAKNCTLGALLMFGGVCAASDPSCRVHTQDHVLVPCQFENMTFYLGQVGVFRLMDAPEHIDTRLHWHADTAPWLHEQKTKTTKHPNKSRRSFWPRWQDKAFINPQKIGPLGVDPVALTSQAQVQLGLPHHTWQVKTAEQSQFYAHHVHEFSSQAQVLLRSQSQLELSINNQSSQSYLLYLYGHRFYLSNRLILLHALEIPAHRITRIHFRTHQSGALFLHEHRLYHDAHVENEDFHFETVDPFHMAPPTQHQFEQVQIDALKALHKTRVELDLKRTKTDKDLLLNSQHTARSAVAGAREGVDDETADLALRGAYNVSDDTRDSVRTGHDGTQVLNLRRSIDITRRIKLSVTPKYQHIHTHEFEFESALEYKFSPWWYADAYYNYWYEPDAIVHSVGLGTVWVF